MINADLGVVGQQYACAPVLVAMADLVEVIDMVFELLVEA
jgi:hypothetical protein